MNESNSGYLARHFTSSAPLPDHKPAPKPLRCGLEFLNVDFLKPQTRADGAFGDLTSAMADTERMVRALRGK